MDGSDDLTIERAIDTLVKDVNAQGITLAMPDDPLRDAEFIRILNAAYDLGGPATYPEDAPLSAFQLA
jgi:hypothetical protein